MIKGTVVQVWVGQFKSKYYEGYVLEDTTESLRIKSGKGKITLSWDEICFVRESFNPSDKTYDNTGTEVIHKGGTYFLGAENKLRNNTIDEDELRPKKVEQKESKNYKLYVVIGCLVALYFFS